MRWWPFSRRDGGRHSYGAAVTSLPTGPLRLPEPEDLPMPAQEDPLAALLGHEPGPYSLGAPLEPGGDLPPARPWGDPDDPTPTFWPWTQDGPDDLTPPPSPWAQDGPDDVTPSSSPWAQDGPDELTPPSSPWAQDAGAADAGLLPDAPPREAGLLPLPVVTLEPVPVEQREADAPAWQASTGLDDATGDVTGDAVRAAEPDVAHLLPAPGPDVPPLLLATVTPVVEPVPAPALDLTPAPVARRGASSAVFVPRAAPRPAVDPLPWLAPAAGEQPSAHLAPAAPAEPVGDLSFPVVVAPPFVPAAPAPAVAPPRAAPAAPPPPLVGLLPAPRDDRHDARGARVQLGFRDGTSLVLTPGSDSSRALQELARVLLSRG